MKHNNYNPPIITLTAALTAAMVFAAPIKPAFGGQLASPAVDASLFRDGEVKRITNQFGVWSTICDEIPRLHQRFCSLKSIIRNASGEIIANILVSTGENGKPAAIIRVAPGIHLGSGIKVKIETITLQSAPTKSAQKMKVNLERTLNILECDAKTCSTIWPLSHAEIMALNAGKNIIIRIAQVKPFHPLIPMISAPDQLTIIDGKTLGAGFSKAVESTLK